MRSAGFSLRRGEGDCPHRCSHGWKWGRNADANLCHFPPIVADILTIFLFFTFHIFLVVTVSVNRLVHPPKKKNSPPPKKKEFNPTPKFFCEYLGSRHAAPCTLWLHLCAYLSVMNCIYIVQCTECFKYKTHCCKLYEYSMLSRLHWLYVRRHRNHRLSVTYPQSKYKWRSSWCPDRQQHRIDVNVVTEQSIVGTK